MQLQVSTITSSPFGDQKPGTSGLRKKAKLFQQQNYTENFIQSIFDANPGVKLLVVGGDGRFYNLKVIEIIIKIAAANGIPKLVIGRDGLLSTPAASALIRSIKADGGIILTASHNPGGPDGDCGIKFNTSSGSPAPESVTDAIFKRTTSIKEYKTLSGSLSDQINLANLAASQFNSTSVEVVDSVSNYLDLMRQVFDLEIIKTLFSREKPLKMIADCMSGVVGPYASRILVDELGAPRDYLMNAEPKQDFGGKHPDPNLTYAKELVDELKSKTDIHFGVAFDGDGDRNMALGEGAFFVSPGDSLAIVAAHSNCIKWFNANPLQGVARSFPTSMAVDRVAKTLGLKCYETPTGWKFFGNLMDSNLISLCGEESFGMGSNHIREKDGMWACLAWLSIMAKTGKSVKQIVEEHWKRFGRDYFCRYDFEECDSAKCNEMIQRLEELFGSKSLVGQKFGSREQYEVMETGNFEYIDPVDKSISSKQGLFVKFSSGARIVLRLSGTGSSGATVRLYVSDYSPDNVLENSQVYLEELLKIALEISKLREYTGRSEPTVIT